jgi:predicted PurR-regulated permease PerM
MNSTVSKPHWLVSLAIVLLLLYFGRPVLVPLGFAVLISFVIYPICAWLEARRVPRSLAIGAGLLLVGILLGGVVFIVIWQSGEFIKEWPAISLKMDETWKNLGDYLLREFDIPVQEQAYYLESILRNNSSRVLGVFEDMLYFSLTGLVMFILIPFYAALILYYRHLWIRALVAYFGESQRTRIYEIAKESVQTYFNFVKGMLVVYVIVAVLNSVGLALLGVPHPILFGVIASVLTFVPYVGITIGSILPMAVAWVTFNSIWYPLGVVAIFAFVQYLEANVIFPLAVSSNLKVNTLVLIVAIFAGAVIWGGAGMILFIPFLGILKLVADRVPALKPLSITLGTK